MTLPISQCDIKHIMTLPISQCDIKHIMTLPKGHNVFDVTLTDHFQYQSQSIYIDNRWGQREMYNLLIIGLPRYSM
jgi:hypothetical protein